MELAKKVLNPKQKEMTLHVLLSQYTKRINPKREFFQVSIEEIKTFFDLIDGELWVEMPKDNTDSETYDNEYENENENENDSDQTFLNIQNNKCRDASKCFINGQRIRHTIGINKTWIGIYDSLKNGIICNNILYQGRSPLNQFAKMHYEIEQNNRVSVNAWSECECEVDGKWISTYNL
jgi:hypothetical protein